MRSIGFEAYWPEPARQACSDWHWLRAMLAPAAGLPEQEWTVVQRDARENLAAAMLAHSYTSRIQGDPRCKKLLLEAAELARALGQRLIEADSWQQLSQVLLLVEAIRDFDVAGAAIEKSFRLRTAAETEARADDALVKAQIDQLNALKRKDGGAPFEETRSLLRTY